MIPQQINPLGAFVPDHLHCSPARLAEIIESEPRIHRLYLAQVS